MNREEWLESLRKRGWSDSDISKARFAWNAGNRAGKDECAEICRKQWQPIETVPLETEIYVWAEYYDRPILTKAFISSADNKTVLFKGLAREQHPAVWSHIPDPPK